MLIHQGWFTALYSQHLLDSQSFEFLICILQALNMPLVRCTNVSYQGRLSRHITSHSEKTRPESTWVSNSGLAVVIIPPLPPNVTNSRAEPQKPRRWKSMLIHQGWFTALYSQHLLDSQSFEFLICILQALNMPLVRCTNVSYQGRLSRHKINECLLFFVVKKPKQDFGCL